MRPSISAPVAFLSSLAVALFFALPSFAQVNGTPASVTSPGFGGHPVNGPRASVTSVGPQGYAPPPQHHHTKGTGDGHQGHQGHENGSGTTGWYAIPVPYGVDNAVPDEQAADPEGSADQQGGPGAFDHRGPGGPPQAQMAKSAPPAHAAEAEDAPAVEPDPPLPPTLLVFKDGRTVEVSNYAIVGQTVFDLTPGHRRKIALIDLDLDATRKQNEERGNTFELPKGTHVN